MEKNSDLLGSFNTTMSENVLRTLSSNITDGTKIFASVWAYNESKIAYLNMDKVPIGSRVALTFIKGKSGIPYLREFTVLSLPENYLEGDDNDDYI